MTNDEAVAMLATTLSRMQDDLQQARSALAVLRGGEAGAPPAGAGQTVRLKIVEMLPPFEGVSKRTGKPFSKFKAKASDGQVYETFSESIHESLLAALADGGDVELGYTQSRFGRDLVSVTRSDDGGEIPPPSDDDLPF
jgi:hypothetical protein